MLNRCTIPVVLRVLALAGGAEMRIDGLKRSARSLAWATSFSIRP